MHSRYNAYFGFRTPPFSTAASPQFVYENPLHREATLSLLFSIHQLRRLILLTGSSGTGKTTLLYRVASQLTPCYQTLHVPHCPRTFADLLVAAGRHREEQNTLSFSLSPPTLGEVLKLCHRLQKRTVVLLDDAHNLSEEALTALNLLLNLETLSTPLLTLVLAGDSSLETRVQQPVLSDLQKRIDLHLRLHGLHPEETDSYIAYRLRIAGSTRQDLFSPEAIRRITHYSNGVPRLINLFCDKALQTMHLIGARFASAELVDKVAQDIFVVESAAPDSHTREIPVVVLPDRHSASQPKTYPVVVKQSAKHLSWTTLILLLAWALLFQLKQPHQLTYNEVSQQNAPLAVALSDPANQPLPIEPDFTPLPSAPQTDQRQEPRTAPSVSLAGQASDSFTNRFAQAQGDSPAQQPNDPPSTLVLTRSQQPLESAPQQTRQAPSSLTASSPTTLQTSYKEAAHAQLARLGMSANRAALLDSAERSAEHAIRLLLLAGVSPNVRDDRGWTPLMFAARDNQHDLALLLITHGANVNARTKTGGTALMLAAMNNYADMAEFLINKGAHVNATNSQGWTALTYASWKGHQQVVMTLLKQGADTQLKDSQGWTPLQYAAWRQETRPMQAQLRQEIAGALGIDSEDELLTLVSNTDYSAVSQLLRPRVKTY